LQLLTAGEVSGDGLAGPVLAELASRRPDVAWTGFGGAAMRRSSVFHPLGDVSELSGAGLIELLPALPRLLRGRACLVAALKRLPRLAVFVDAPDLHLPLARRARRAGVRAVQLAAPQFWAWRPGRARFLARHLDLVLCLFAFEARLLRRAGARAVHVGHPLADRLPTQAQRRPRPARPVLAVLPGSRPSEVARHLEPFVDAARAALRGREGEIVVPWRLAAAPPQLPGVRFDRRAGFQVLIEADVALVAVGTATLEAAALGVPTVAAARLHPVTAAAARRLLRTPWTALPNILLGEGAIPEHLQDLGGLTGDLERLLHDPDEAAGRAAEIAHRLRPELGPAGFAPRVADCLLPLLRD
jgi:lipid-A-disaccharide synthase